MQKELSIGTCCVNHFIFSSIIDYKICKPEHKDRKEANYRYLIRNYFIR